MCLCSVSGSGGGAVSHLGPGKNAMCPARLSGQDGTAGGLCLCQLLWFAALGGCLGTLAAADRCKCSTELCGDHNSCVRLRCFFSGRGGACAGRRDAKKSIHGDICDSESGLVILGGVAGSGKSTTIASIIDYINENKCVHILTLEDPIEYVHTHKNAIVNQREVGIDVASYDEGLKLAIREDVDVIQVGRMSEPDTVKAVIKAAKAGSFVIAAVDVAGTKDIIQSIIDEFPPSEKEKINTQLKEVLKMVVSQKLIQQDKDGIKASFEILKIN